jgi:hypothetical protein
MFSDECNVRELLRLAGRPTYSVGFGTPPNVALNASAHHRSCHRLDLPLLSPSPSSLGRLQAIHPELHPAQCNTTCTKLHNSIFAQPTRRHTDRHADHSPFLPRTARAETLLPQRVARCPVIDAPYSLVAARAHVEMQGRAADAEDGKPWSFSSEVEFAELGFKNV